MTKRKAKFDEIGYWSEVKLEIVKKYAGAYSTILANQSGFHHSYIDGFAGAGVHISKTSGQWVPGSPLNALIIQPPFRHYYLIDLDGGRIELLRGIVGDRQDVTLLQGDCNDVLVNQVFPRVQYSRYERALCLLDPYAINLNWEVLWSAGQSRAIDLFLNFPIMDMNRNTLWSDASRVSTSQARRLTAFWGDESWRTAAYRKKSQSDLFGGAELEKTTNAEVVAAFRARLRDAAGFKNVPAPMPMRNRTGAVVYYLFFASQSDLGNKIFKEISARYRDHRGDAGDTNP